MLRNWTFFGAPLAGVVCIHYELGHADSLGVGMFLQTFLLALTARGLDSCVQISMAGYPEIVREQLGIGDTLAWCLDLPNYPNVSRRCHYDRWARTPVDGDGG